MATFTALELLTFLLAILIVAAPAAVLLRALAPELPATDLAVSGLLLGLALHVIALSWVPGAGWWLELVLAAGGLAGALVLRRPTSGVAPPDPVAATGEPHAAWALGAVLCGQFALLLVPFLWTPLPFGTDPVYHVAISDKIARTGGIPGDFLPYDPVAPTYTLGSHLAVAFGSAVTSLPIHRLYQLLLPLCLVVSAGVIFQIGRVAFGVRVGLAAAFAYGFFANWGSLDLLRWGSVPNALGMAFVLGAVRFLLAPTGRLPLALPAIFVAATAATHHLSALIFGLVCGVWALVAVRGSGWHAPFVRSIAGAWAVGIALVAPAVWALAVEVVRSVLSAEEAALDAGLPYLNVVEPLVPVWAVPGKLGVVLFVLAAVGLWRARRGGPAASPSRAVLIWTVTMAVAFAALDWLLRWIVDAIWQRDLAILTPSRFLTDLAYPLSLFAGVALASFWRSARWMALTLIAAGPLYAWSLLAPMAAARVPPAEIEGLRWLAAHTPADSLVLQAPQWTTYVSGREGDWMVLREERLSGYTDRKRRLADQGSAAIAAWIQAHGRPVYLWETRDLPARNLDRVWQGDGIHIYRFLTDTR